MKTGQAEPKMTATSDFVGYMAQARHIRMNLVTGSVGTADKPGTIAIPVSMEQPILDHGGLVFRDTPVMADNVICTIPPKFVFNVLPKEPFPAEWVHFLEEEHWGIGLLTGWVGTKRSIIEDLGIDKRSFIYMPGITTEDEGFIGVVDMVMGEFNGWNDGKADRAPAG